jgi:hypothetical protein
MIAPSHDVGDPSAPAPAPIVAAPARPPIWRALQLVAGIVLFLYALRLLAPLPLDRMPFVLLAALLAAGAMAVAESLVGLLHSLVENFRKA